MKASGKEKLGDAIKHVSAHAATCKMCTSKTQALNEAVSWLSEQQHNELASAFTSHCNGCGKEIYVSTSWNVACLNGSKYWECNLAAVWRQINTGGGFAPLRETVSSIGVPVMSNNAFINTECSQASM